MNRMAIVIGAVLLVGVLELIAVSNQRDALLLVAGLPVAGALGLLVWSLLERSRRLRIMPGDNEIDNGPADMLRRWEARASMLADRADGSRADWDRHLRPLLAKEFELTSGHRMAKNRRATEAAGQLLFGPELWRWVDPANSALRDQSNPAPGRPALDEILRRLQNM
ncbi:hypothetical protein [Nocardia huaxiensis]|uniref:Uncharacterized protein n=1 Tax=Nocardia huaxiensis TaxID=2755382 RepID=A0A7D6VK88_9NOCA|nr:hypothetical protein [Nocardia huaxiensis]QLY31470.1 hypothetical protein H0264_03750 [Nocardia huaxiensis]UFS95021.1 hypothetical protein LPY97_30585 [Nocardia huaxiensis]